MVTVTVATLVVLVLGMISGAFSTWASMILNFIGNIFDESFYNVMAIETNFYDMGRSNAGAFGLSEKSGNGARGHIAYFNMTSLYSTIYTFALALLILFFVKKLVEVYFAWNNGDPETSPFSVLLGFIKALIIMICFGFIYQTIVEIFAQLFQGMLASAFGSKLESLAGTLTNQAKNTNYWLNNLGVFIYFITAIFMLLIYFKTLGMGMELLILRFGMPFACIGLLNADGGAFRGCMQKIIKCGFTIIVQLMLMRLSIAFIFGYHLILSFITAMMGLKTPSLLNEFMYTAGGYYGGAGNISRVASKASSAMSKGG